jgi:Na+-transporting NADH:ubiquinone oxidoreductase subunit C
MSHDSTKKTIIVALGVCLVCSVLVSTAAVSLSGIQKANKELDRIQNILQAGSVEYTGKDAVELYNEKIKSIVIEIKSGEILDEASLAEEIKPKNFDIKKLASDPSFGLIIDPDKDIAQIKRKPKNMIIYEVMSPDNEVEKYIFPVWGFGLWSTMYGFVALDNDLQTVEGITFYEHGETPGLGGEIDNSRWKASWKGKKVLNEKGEVVLDVIKGAVDVTSSKANMQIDGLSGSTITTKGVDQMIKYWFGDDGYGSFLDKLRKTEGGKNEEV